MKQVFRLKPMVLLRVLAELTVLAALIAVPLALLVDGSFARFSVTIKIVLAVLPFIALIILPFYGLITWQVIFNDQGLKLYSVFKVHKIAWRSIKDLSMRTVWSWRSYVLKHENGEVSFPIWLSKSEDLAKVIRSRLPGGGVSAGAERGYMQHKTALILKLVKVILTLLVVIIFWIFFAETAQSQQTNNTDLILLLAFCMGGTGIIVWRAAVSLVLMPRFVEVTGGGLVVRTLFAAKKVAWADVKQIVPAPLLLPEGLMLKSKSGDFLLSEELDDFDQLADSLKSKIGKK